MNNTSKVSSMRIRETTKEKIRGLQQPHESLEETVFRVFSEIEKQYL
jgi:hypothetical protein